MINQATLAQKVWQNPYYFIAFGLGIGLMPVAPGTFGTLLAIPLMYLFCTKPILLQLCIVTIVGIVGLCSAQKVTQDLKQNDYKGIVIDEIVGYFVTMMGVPFTIPMVIVGFCLFRWLDIVKPDPIRWVDNRMEGGLGIMLDDLLAGLIACFFLHLGLFFYSLI